jgi:hypothetical protein
MVALLIDRLEYIFRSSHPVSISLLAHYLIHYVKNNMKLMKQTAVEKTIPYYLFVSSIYIEIYFKTLMVQSCCIFK